MDCGAAGKLRRFSFSDSFHTDYRRKITEYPLFMTNMK